MFHSLHYNSGGLIDMVRIRLICEELVRFVSDVKNWYSIFTKVKNGYQFLTHVNNWYSIFTNVKNGKILTHVKNWYQMLTYVKNWYHIQLEQSSQMSMAECVIYNHM